eukprot:Sspe_Gene.94945::Locus_67260_Transcript_1_1_Confidence_1.000_Length_1395::g.94945::m.94945
MASRGPLPPQDMGMENGTGRKRGRKVPTPIELYVKASWREAKRDNPEVAAPELRRRLREVAWPGLDPEEQAEYVKQSNAMREAADAADSSPTPRRPAKKRERA